MCARDPSQIVSISQLNSLHNVLEVIQSSPIPICVRDGNGKFIVHNIAFKQRLCCNFSTCNDWFSSLSTINILTIRRKELDSFQKNNSISVIRKIDFNKIFWDINFIPFQNENNYFSLWVFSLSEDELLEPSNGNICIRDEFIHKFKVEAKPIYWKVYLLYVSGFSHQLISEKLSLKSGVSRNIVTSIHKFFNVSLRDDLILHYYNSGFFYSILNQARCLIHRKKKDINI